MWVQQYCLAYFKQTFSSKQIFFFVFCWFFFLGGTLHDFKWQRCSRWEAQSSLAELRVLHAIMCFLFGKERQNWAFSQLEMGGSGAGSELVMMAAVNSMSVQAIKEKKKKKKRQDRHGTCETPPASSTQFCANLCWNTTSVDLFSSRKWNSNAYIPVSYHQASSLWP